MKGTLGEYIRPIVFGLQDGLVSTTGAVTGIAVGVQNKLIVILSGIIIIFVESLSMASGEYLSSKSEVEFHTNGKKKNEQTHPLNPKVNALFMGISYLLGGSVPLIPYFLLELPTSIYYSVTATAMALFLVGYEKSKFVGQKALRGGIEMLTIAGASALVGYSIGYLARMYFEIPVI